MTYITTVDRLIREARQKGERRGMRRGMREGMREGRCDQLCFTAAKKFDAATASQLKTLLKTIEDTNVLIKVGESLIDCNSGDEFIDVCKGLS